MIQFYINFGNNVLPVQLFTLIDFLSNLFLEGTFKDFSINTIECRQVDIIV